MSVCKHLCLSNSSILGYTNLLLILIPFNGPAVFSSSMTLASALNILFIANNQNPNKTGSFSVIFLCTGYYLNS